MVTRIRFQFLAGVASILAAMTGCGDPAAEDGQVDHDGVAQHDGIGDQGEGAEGEEGGLHLGEVARYTVPCPTAGEVPNLVSNPNASFASWMNPSMIRGLGRTGATVTLHKIPALSSSSDSNGFEYISGGVVCRQVFELGYSQGGLNRSATGKFNPATQKGMARITVRTKVIPWPNYVIESTSGSSVTVKYLKGAVNGIGPTKR